MLPLLTLPPLLALRVLLACLVFLLIDLRLVLAATVAGLGLSHDARALSKILPMLLSVTWLRVFLLDRLLLDRLMIVFMRDTHLLIIKVVMVRIFLLGYK